MSQHAQRTIRPSFHGNKNTLLGFHIIVIADFQLSTLIINSYVRWLSSYDLCQAQSFLSFDQLNYFKILSTTTHASHRTAAQLTISRDQNNSEAKLSSIRSIALEGEIYTGEFSSSLILWILNFQESSAKVSRIPCSVRKETNGDSDSSRGLHAHPPLGHQLLRRACLQNTVSAFVHQRPNFIEMKKSEDLTEDSIGGSCRVNAAVFFKI